MKITVTKIVGRSTLVAEVEGDKELDTLIRASLFASMPDECGLCKSTDVKLISNKADTYQYAKIQCGTCTATSTMGQYRDGGGGFWKEFSIYKKGVQDDK